MSPTTVRFFVPGTPAAQPRPRVVTRDRHRRRLRRPRAISNTGDIVEIKRRLARFAAIALRRRGGMLLEGPVRLTIEAVFPMPKKNRRPWAWKATRPDIDNIAKCVLDALNGTLWHDDGQVADLCLRKVYSPNSDDVGVIVTAERLIDTECEANVAAVNLAFRRELARKETSR